MKKITTLIGILLALSLSIGSNLLAMHSRPSSALSIKSAKSAAPDSSSSSDADELVPSTEISPELSKLNNRADELATEATRLGRVAAQQNSRFKTHVNTLSTNFSDAKKDDQPQDFVRTLFNKINVLKKFISNDQPDQD